MWGGGTFGPLWISLERLSGGSCVESQCEHAWSQPSQLYGNYAPPLCLPCPPMTLQGRRVLAVAGRGDSGAVRLSVLRPSGATSREGWENASVKFLSATWVFVVVR